MKLPLGFRPMKPQTLDSLDQLGKYPYYVEAKLDGLRAICTNGKFRSNTLKEFPNRNLKSRFEFLLATRQALYDGELYIPGKTLQDVQSVVMSEDGDVSELVYVVFDMVIDENNFKMGYGNRFSWLLDSLNSHVFNNVLMVHWYRCDNKEEVEKREEWLVSKGYEGIIIRRPDSIYKFGRATAKEDSFWKFKRVEDAEARIVGVVELKHNNNSLEYDERGLAKRSSHKDNKESSGIAGSLRVIGVNGKYKDREFFVSLGSMTLRERRRIWLFNHNQENRTITYTYAKHRGTIEAPAEPRFKAFRFDI